MDSSLLPQSLGFTLWRNQKYGSQKGAIMHGNFHLFIYSATIWLILLVNSVADVSDNWLLLMCLNNEKRVIINVPLPNQQSNLSLHTLEGHETKKKSE